MQELTKAEERIMQILWKIEKGFVKDILEHFPDPKPPYNTISTIIRIMDQKEIVGHKSYGNSYQYYPMITQEEYTHKYLNRFMKNYFGNSFRKLVHFFSNQQDLTVEEVDKVIEMLEEIKKQKIEKNG
jgi:BlaI family transcriptional regulator, penicillinase repressor